MARGPKKHLKRLNAPKAWMLDKLGGVYAPRPSTGPHKLRECLPLVIFLRNRLKYALTGNEVLKIVKQRLIKVDGKVRTDPTYPAGFMDVVSIEKTNELFRLIYDVKGRFTIHRITPEEAKARGPKKHLKRLNAPKAWMLDKLGGVYAPRPSTGPHKLRECLPLVIFLRNRLKYALTGNEVLKIVKQRLIKVDGKVRTDPTYPAGFMDVVSIEKTNELFRLIYDVKGRFTIHRITPEEAKYKLCKVRQVGTGPKNVPFLVTHDGRTLRYPDPLIKVHDSVQLEIATGRLMDFIKFESGNLCMITGGRNLGRVGTIVSRERHPGSFDIVHIKDSTGHTFATRLNNVFIIGKGTKAYISLPRGKGVRLTIAEERDKRIAAKVAAH
ncbi:hypothetical protein K1T71_004785 [Dendrolimus kikuchii]|uniref:Uncharacterized protein n=1 Tax=Dendrolimus kikuchii TaxID=765133 RepID=A0ACC1D8D4_9NEOP|nr:hypothetical protein K1T71_004785 [Dendrolimus kikuchii]